MPIGFKTLIFLEPLLLFGCLLFRWAVRPEVKRDFDGRIIGLVLAIPAVAYLAPHVAILYAFLIVAPAVLARDRAHAAALFALMVPMLPILGGRIAPGGFFIIDMTTVKACILGLALAVAARPGRMGGRGTAIDALLVLYALMLLLAQSRGASATEWVRAVVDMGLSTLLIFVLISRTLQTSEDCRRFATFFGAAATILAVIAINEAIRRWPFYQGLYMHFNMMELWVNLSIRVRAGMLRTPGPFGDATTFGTFLMIGLLAVLCLRSIFASQGRRLVVTAVVAIGLLAPQSRGAILSAAFGVLLIELYRGRLVYVVGAAIAAALGGAILFLRAQQSIVLAEFLGLTKGHTGTVDYRARLFERGLEEIWKHPLFGARMKDVVRALKDLEQGEHIVDFVNSYLTIALMGGLVGLGIVFLLYSGLLAGYLGRRDQMLRSASGWESASFGFAAFGALALSLVFSSLSERNPLWVVVLTGYSAALFRIDWRSAGRAAGQGRTGAAGVLPPPVPAYRDNVAANASTARALGASSSG